VPELTRLATEPIAPDWLTVQEAADMLRTGRRSIYRAINSTQLRAARINKRGDLRIARAWLLDWCAAQAERS